MGAACELNTRTNSQTQKSVLRFTLSHTHLHLAGHQSQELGEIDRAVAVSIDLVDHVRELALCKPDTHRENMESEAEE